ncbi:GNAT family N-acetyltransferase [Rhizobium sp. S95]|uniref:GNAT family N-acetyltransferase n=1 Tax=Ciceribacter sichuanensis TaxID=2949647 RepID=A0AAJ1C108_9HYPH|nr:MULTISPECIES: GNAT family N-acetyltransferase [unclassified Ciceribacter]MCM2394490.1 GNAT family N-acetyltransferase [Ciceribacter sp. S95]MCO5958803.1 GNAT family N-acetyltransferase [Ciceribacter sp. S101]
MLRDKVIFEASRKGYTLSTDRSRFDPVEVHRFLVNESYWARNLTFDQLERALEGSLPVAIYAPDGTLAAFGRLVTDYAVFAYLRDVFTLPAHRGQGLASWLALEIRNHPELATVTSWMLATKDAHAVYEKAGYRPAPHPEYYMTVPKLE